MSSQRRTTMRLGSDSIRNTSYFCPDDILGTGGQRMLRTTLKNKDKINQRIGEKVLPDWVRSGTENNEVYRLPLKTDVLKERLVEHQHIPVDLVLRLGGQTARLDVEIRGGATTLQGRQHITPQQETEMVAEIREALRSQVTQQVNQLLAVTLHEELTERIKVHAKVEKKTIREQITTGNTIRTYAFAQL